MFARNPGKGITLEMYIRNTQVNKKKKKVSWRTAVVNPALKKQRSLCSAWPAWFSCDPGSILTCSSQPVTPLTGDAVPLSIRHSSGTQT